MKPVILVIAAALSLCFVKAQPGTTDTNYTTRISSTEWMPDGRGILLGIIKHHKTHQQAPFFSKVFLYDVQTGQLKYLFDDGSNLAPSPDGKMIAFLKRGERKKTDIFFFDMAKRKITTLKSDTGSKYGLTWSPNGKDLAYNVMTRGKPGVDIFVLNLETTEIKQITTSGNYSSYNPQWSPGGSRIIYYFEKGDSHDQIWMTDPRGSFHKNLTNDTTTHNYYPSWMDDSTIIYTQSPFTLMTMSDKGNNKRILQGINATPVKYNRPTAKFAYIKSEEENKLMFFNRKSKEVTEVLDGTKLLSLFNTFR